MTGISFGAAVAAMKFGQRVKRRSWKAYLSLSGEMNTRIMVCPLEGSRKVQWHSQDVDLLAEDWEILADTSETLNGDLQR